MRLQEGRYYGHPNPHRDECVFRDGSFQGVAPLPNYEPPIADLGASRSANGTIEYESSSAHCGALEGDLVIANYSIGDNLTRVELSDDGESVLATSNLFGGFNEPLPLAQDPEGHHLRGRVHLRRRDGAHPPSTRAAGLSGTRDPWRCSTRVGRSSEESFSVRGEEDSGHVSTMRIYDSGHGLWSVGPPLPGPAVENPAVAAEGGKLYVFGGSASGSFSGVTNAAVFDPATNSWTQLPAMPTARGGATAQALGGKIYVVGGLGTDSASSRRWTPRSRFRRLELGRRDGDPPGQRGVRGARGKLYVFGGGTRNTTGGYAEGNLTSVEMYDPDTNSWVPGADMPTGTPVHGGGTLNGRAQLIGGERKGADDSFPENEEYDPTADSWRTLTPMPTPRHGAVAGTIGETIYVASGGPRAGTTFSAVNEAFSFSESSTPGLPTPDRPRIRSSPT